MGFESDVMLKGNEVILPVKICTLQQVKANSPDFNALKVDSKVICNIPNFTPIPLQFSPQFSIQH